VRSLLTLLLAHRCPREIAPNDGNEIGPCKKNEVHSMTPQTQKRRSAVSTYHCLGNRRWQRWRVQQGNLAIYVCPSLLLSPCCFPTDFYRLRFVLTFSYLFRLLVRTMIWAPMKNLEKKRAFSLPE
jgi:hypothetical protein